jgi:hypothetical protein
VILAVFGFGFENISLTVADFYKFDKITNIKRFYPENVTFPAITICNYEGYQREHYIDGLLIETDTVSIILLKKFVDFEKTRFYSFKNDSNLQVKNHLDNFKMKDPVDGFYYDCLRFNAVTNKSVKLFKAISIQDRLLIFLKKINREDISDIEYYHYTVIRDYFYFYIGDNSLKSVENLLYLSLSPGSYYKIEIEKVSIETKLPEPYNLCKKSSFDEPYHQMNCIEACTYKEIKNKYNCTFHSTLFSIQGFRQSLWHYLGLNKYNRLKSEFSESCLKECPLESCFSEKFFFYTTRSVHFS